MTAYDVFDLLHDSGHLLSRGADESRRFGDEPIEILSCQPESRVSCQPFD